MVIISHWNICSRAYGNVEMRARCLLRWIAERGTCCLPSNLNVGMFQNQKNNQILGMGS